MSGTREDCFRDGSENYQEAEKELDKNIAKALRQIEQRKRRPYPTGEILCGQAGRD